MYLFAGSELIPRDATQLARRADKPHFLKSLQVAIHGRLVDPSGDQLAHQIGVRHGTFGSLKRSKHSKSWLSGSKSGVSKDFSRGDGVHEYLANAS